jgi:hypothetical protein
MGVRTESLACCELRMEEVYVFRAPHSPLVLFAFTIATAFWNHMLCLGCLPFRTHTQEGTVVKSFTTEHRVSC